MDYSILPFMDQDTEGVKNVVLEGLSAFGYAYNKDLDADLDNPKSFYIDTGGMFYVLKINDIIVGTVAVINKGNSIAELKRLYVKKKYQGQGLGSALLDKAISYAKEHGCKKMELETNKKFAKAHLLYQKRGFHLMSRDKDSFYMEKVF